MSQDADHKIVILGAGTVGKSALTIRMVANTFKEVYDATIEDRYQCDMTVNGRQIKLDILDTAGQEQFEALQHHWIREGDAFLLVFAVNARQTFTHCKTHYWKQINRIKEDSKRIDLVLVGNKSDLPENEHQVTYQEVEECARQWQVPFIMTSAKDNINVREAFETVVKEVLKHKESPMPEEYNTGCSCQIL